MAYVYRFLDIYDNVIYWGGSLDIQGRHWAKECSNILQKGIYLKNVTTQSQV